MGLHIYNMSLWLYGYNCGLAKLFYQLAATKNAVNRKFSRICVSTSQLDE